MLPLLERASAGCGGLVLGLGDLDVVVGSDCAAAGVGCVRDSDSDGGVGGGVDCDGCGEVRWGEGVGGGVADGDADPCWFGAVDDDEGPLEPNLGLLIGWLEDGGEGECSG